MKPISLVWTILFACLVSSTTTAQTRCDTAIAGVDVNLSLSSNCHLEVLPKSVMSNFDTIGQFGLTITNSNGDTIPMPLTVEHLGIKLTVGIIDSACGTTMGVFNRVGTSTITLEDYQPPIISCVDTMLTCDQFFFYTPDTIIQDCQPFTVDILSQTFDPLCADSLASRVTRTFRATDASGNSSICTDTIVVKRFDLDSNVVFPRDIEIDCSTASIFINADGTLKKPPTELPVDSFARDSIYRFGVPVTGSGVPLHGLNFKECNVRAFLRDSDPTITPCKTIYRREWTVYEWHCDVERSRTMVQLISIVDTMPPKLVFNQDTFFQYINDVSCTATFTLPQPDTLSDFCQDSSRYNVIVENSGGPILFSLHDTIESIGVDTITLKYIANDGCGNMAIDSVVVIIGDTIPPVALGLSSYVVALKDSIQTGVAATTFNNGTSDACGPITIDAARLDEGVFRDSVFFSCADSDSMITVKVRFTDIYGATSSVNVNVTVDSTGASCPSSLVSPSPSSAIVVSGQITYEDGLQFPNATVDITGDYAQSVRTDESGIFEVVGIPADQDIFVMPKRDVEDIKGVTTLDIIHMQRHILGIEELDSPYKIIAGDVNNNSRLNAADLIHVRRLILAMTESFPLVDSYVFIPVDTKFEDPYDPWSGGKIFGKSMITTDGLQEANFMAIKMGDVDKSLLRSRGRSSDEFTLAYDVSEFSNIVEIQFFANEDISMDGFQGTFTFNHSALRLLNVHHGQIHIGKENINLDMAEEGVITMSWNDYVETDITTDKPIFRMLFQKTGPLEKGLVNTQNGPLYSEIYLDGEAYTLNLEEMLQVSNIDFDEVAIVPNPWTDKTNITFNVPEDGAVAINIYDASMRRIWTQRNNVSQGEVQIELSNNELPEAGVYIYEVIFKDEVRIAKMTKL